MKNLTDWLNTNKISLNVQKTELVIFKHQRKKIVKLRLELVENDSTQQILLRWLAWLIWNWFFRTNFFIIW